MPQMMPMFWILLLLFSTLTLLTTISFLYFISIPSSLPPSSKKLLKMMKWNWMW